MKKSLLDVIFASDKRKNVLLLLQDGAKEMEYLLKSLNTTRTALLPQIRMLEEHYLVSHNKDIYELTDIGKLLVDEMKSLVNTIDIFDTDIDYWGTHDLSFIPLHLLDRITEIEECMIFNPSNEEMFEAHNASIETSKNYHYSITTFFYPHFRDIFSQILSEGAEMHVIIPQSLYDKLRIDNYTDFKELLGNDLVHFYLYPKKMNLFAFVINEKMIMISLLKMNGSFDNRHIISEKPSAIKWARDVFDYYLKYSAPIIEI